MPKFKYILASFLLLSACQSSSFIESAGGSPEDQLANAELQMTKYPNDLGAGVLAAHSADKAIKAYQKQNNLIGLGNAYYVKGKVFKVFEKSADGLQRSYENQMQAISYYNKAGYNPGLAVSNAELMQVNFVGGKKENACKYGNTAIEKFEAAKTTQPGISIPVYTSNQDFGGFVKTMMQQRGCGN